MLNNTAPVGASFQNNSFGGDVHLENLTAIQNNITQLLSQQPTASKLPESWNVPQRNSQFTGRKEFLAEITQCLNQRNASLVACVGLGGVGKTSLVLEYVYRNLNTYKGGVGWFFCRDKNFLIREFIRLGVQLGVLQSQNRDEQNQQHLDDDNIRVFKTWLEDSQRSGWLLIFDNVENYDDVCHLFPNKGGKIIVTSRYQIWDNVIAVNAFERFESIEYFKKVCPKRTSDDEWNELANILGDLPLALDQASAYLRENETVSLADYITNYWSKKKIFLSSNKLENYNKIPVYLTWDITMEKIREKLPLAAKLLYALALVSNNNIPYNIFENFVDIFNPSGHEPKETVEEMLAMLQRYSLISCNSEKKISTMHSLLQEVLRLKVVEEANVDLVKETMVLFVLWLKTRRLSVMKKDDIADLVLQWNSFIAFLKSFNQIQGGDERLKCGPQFISSLPIFGELEYYIEEFENALATEDLHLKSIETQGDIDDKIILDISSYKTEMMSIIGRVKSSVTGDEEILENLVDGFENDNKMNEMSPAFILISLLKAYSMKDRKLKFKNIFDKILRIYNKNTLRDNLISLICHTWNAHEDKRNLVEKYEKFLSNYPMGVSPIEECALYKIIRQMFDYIEDPYAKPLPLIPDWFFLKYNSNVTTAIADIRTKITEMTSSEDILLKVSYQCILAAFYSEIDDYIMVDFYLNESANAIQTAESEKSERSFVALKALADTYFHARQIIRAKALYVKSLQVATSVYHPRHFNVLSARLSVCMMSYIIDGDDNSWKEITNFFHNPSSTDEEFMRVMTDIYLKYSYQAFRYGPETMAVQVLNDMLVLNFKFYSISYLTVEINKEALRTILINGGECEKFISRLLQKSDRNAYFLELTISETWVVFLLLFSLYGRLPEIDFRGTDGNDYALLCCWPDNIKMAICDDSFDIIASFLRIMELIPLNALHLCHLLERKGKILRALGQYEEAREVFSRLSHVITKWNSFNKKPHIMQAYHLGVIYADLGLLEKAEKNLLNTFIMALDYCGVSPRVVETMIYYLGTLCLELDRWNDAKLFFNHCLKFQSIFYKYEDLELIFRIRIQILQFFMYGYDLNIDCTDNKKKVMQILLVRHLRSLYLENFKENHAISALMRVFTGLILMNYFIGDKSMDVSLVHDIASSLRPSKLKANKLQWADWLMDIADVLLCVEDYTNAKIYLQDVLKMYSNVHGQDHQKIKEIHFKLGSVFTCLNNFSEAYKSFVKGLSTEEDRTTLCWSLLRLGRLFWLLDKNSYIPLRTLFGRKAISDLWQPITNRQKLNHLKCCDKELGAFWAALQSNVYKHKKIFGQLNRELILSELEVCKKSNTPFNSPKINYFLFLIANSCEEYHRTSRNIRTKSLQSCLNMLINYTVQQILTNAVFLFTH